MEITVTPDNVALINALVFVAFAIPMVPLVLGWRGFAKQGPRWLAGIALGIVTTSYLWVLGVLAGAPVIAPHYTTARAYTIDLNAGAALVAMVLLAIVEKPMRWYHVVAGCGVAVLWMYLAVVGSVV